MSTNTAMINLMISEAQMVIAREPAQLDTVGLLKSAMHTCAEHWMCTDAELQLTAAIGATLVELGPDHPDYEVVVTEFKAIRAVNAGLQAMLSGVKIDLDSIQMPDNAFGILDLWNTVIEDKT